MDQNNPLSELTTRDVFPPWVPAVFPESGPDSRCVDVHYTHYGRMCPHRDAGRSQHRLINSLATYGAVNQYGFVEAPYRVIDKSDPSNPRVTDEVIYLTADEEDNYIVAQANEPLDEDGHFVHNNIPAGSEKRHPPSRSVPLI